MMQWVAAGSGINMNYRFSQPGTTQRNRQDQLYHGVVLPVRQRDAPPTTSAARPRAATTVARRPNTCPLAMEIYSSNEYWVKTASLFHTDTRGHRRPPRPSARAALSHFEPSARRRRQRQRAGATASSSAIRCTRRRCSARSAMRSTNGRPRASQPPPSMIPQLLRRHARGADAAGRRRIPEHSGRQLHRPQVDSLPVQLRARTSTAPAS